MHSDEVAGIRSITRSRGAIAANRDPRLARTGSCHGVAGGGGKRMIVIRSERLQLRELELQDDEFILKLLNEARVRALHRRQRGEKLARRPRIHFEGSDGQLSALRFRACIWQRCVDSGLPIGICGLVKRDTLPDVDVGFAFLSRYWSRGYAAESAAAVLAYGTRQLRLPRIVAITAPDNRASIAVLEKIGLKFERMVKLTDDGEELKMFGPTPLEDRSSGI